jgi:hypothetical protein
VAACGYEVLARTDDTEVDTFIKQESSLFLFFQGHPEYESDTLYRERSDRLLLVTSSDPPVTIRMLMHFNFAGLKISSNSRVRD